MKKQTSKTTKPATKNVAKKTKKKPKLGTGKRFSQLTKSLEKKGAKDAGALSAWIGQKKYGTKKMTKLAVAGKKRKAKKK